DCRSGQFWHRAVFDGTVALRRFDKLTGYQSRSLLMVPLVSRSGEVLGVLQLLNAHDPLAREVVPFSPEIQRFVEAVAAQAAISIEIQNLIVTQRQLMDAFIEMLASAIDAKSPYTGGHCARVPELARLLAETTCAQKEGPFADFDLTTDDQWHEFKIASLLHDCGKITSTDAIVDKATKLETVFNRIHEIRTRFEVLWRDAEITYWRRCALETPSPEQKSLLDQELAATRQTLQEEFAFVAGCNIGGEYMGPEAQQRLRSIASRSWLRHFDNTLGLSHEELRLHHPHNSGSLPAEEFLLADRPEHVILRDNPNPYGENPWGFKTPVPPALSNQGELYNLSIPRGTLNTEERFKINEHVIQTFVILKHLPFPRELARVPEYAGSHHETMHGTGYPRQLTKEQLSIPARILAIADIFEALTACDRPYKKAKKLGEALKIMSLMAKEGQVDPELFNLFLTSGVYRTYAEKFLTAEQLDMTDPNEFLLPSDKG
ncbi:MAG: HD domain-containing protein, partial [Magnetococcales bacterium]|nr:HD domain-containing protein [Magnetococcales bacterium]